jgi:hypothetical protein
MNWIEQNARQYAEERTTNPQKQEAFIAGAKWFAECVRRMLDQSPYWSMMDKDTKKMVAEIALTSLEEGIYELLARREELKCP